ncbi:MAG: PQQ-like beta-propeller repeat protein, partial [Planctomycetota bacterium]|nr:PQQ-like beta-propeller repeat protein [Planctomycetota bacterium]
MRNVLRVAVLLGMVLSVVESTARAEGQATPVATWPQWRGPSRDGQIPAGTIWPTKLGGKNLQTLWRLPLGPSYSGPIVSVDRVFVTETRNSKEEVVKALDRRTGNVLWEVSWPGAMSMPFFAKSNGDWIRSTPAYDGESLYVAGIRDLLVCLDATTGAERWKVDFPSRYKSSLPAFGFVCSPLVVGDALYVQAGASLFKLDKRTGESIWRTLTDDGGMNGSAFSSPYLAQIGGAEQLLVQTRTKLAGVDPETGSVRWEQEVPAFRGMNILTPTVYRDSVFTSTYGGKSFLYTPTTDGTKPKVETTWTNKVEGYMSSPVVVGNHVYLHLRNQRLTCIDMTTGKSTWTTTPFGKYMSLVANGDKILALDERGILVLFWANPEKFEQLDTRQISEQDTWAHLAICGAEV